MTIRDLFRQVRHGVVRPVETRIVGGAGVWERLSDVQVGTLDQSASLIEGVESRLGAAILDTDERIRGVDRRLMDLCDEVEGMRQQIHGVKKKLTVDAQKIAELEFTHSYHGELAELELDRRARNVVEQLLPFRASNPPLRRFGSDADGGYHLADDVTTADQVVSIGIGDEVTFDWAIYAHAKGVVMVDGTVDFATIAPPGATPINANLIPSDPTRSEEASGVTLADLVESHPSDDYILKMDIEGAEWEVLKACSSDLLSSFRQVAIEFHELTNLWETNAYDRCLGVLTKLNATHRPVCLHANNAGTYRVLGGVPVPDIVEVTWLRRDSYDLEPLRMTELPEDVGRNLPMAPAQIVWWAI